MKKIQSCRKAFDSHTHTHTHAHTHSHSHTLTHTHTHTLTHTHTHTHTHSHTHTHTHTHTLTHTHTHTRVPSINCDTDGMNIDPPNVLKFAGVSHCTKELFNAESQISVRLRHLEEKGNLYL